MKYIVSFGVDKFEFKDGTTAINFAEIAVEHFKPSEYNKKLKPYIYMEDEEEEEC